MKTAGCDEDFYLWTESQAALLLDVRPSHVDCSNIAEELESMGKAGLPRGAKPVGDVNGSPSEMGVLNGQANPELASHHRRATGSARSYSERLAESPRKDAARLDELVSRGGTESRPRDRRRSSTDIALRVGIDSAGRARTLGSYRQLQSAGRKFLRGRITLPEALENDYTNCRRIGDLRPSRNNSNFTCLGL